MFIKALSADQLERIQERFSRLYGPKHAEQCIERLVALAGRYGVGYQSAPKKPHWSEQTAVLITYADSIRRAGELPLDTLRTFAESHLEGVINTLHILPFCPWSSDDGFSVLDYRQVHPEYGNWSHIRNLTESFDLMFDLVLNHVSSQSRWFKNYCAGIAPYRDYFIEANPADDLSAVVRPRNLPLLSTIRVNGTEKHLWTTFSADQIDLNFANPDVLFDFLDILLFYISNGAKIIRLDAIAYLWKQPGTPCIHLEQTHEVVKILRALLELVAPEVVLLTETNVPHDENITYFGEGNEAHMVYQFSLPPLLLHALSTGCGTHLTAWAQTVCKTPPGCTWFNFTASHDGIGLRPLTGLIPHAELDALVEKAKTLGGQVSTRRNSDGSETPYEINITYFDALGGDALHEARFLCSQTIMLGLKGVPGIYLHSLTATPNDLDGMNATGRARSINRKKWDADELEALLNEPNATSRIFNETRRRLTIRRRQHAFHPDSAQRVLDLGDALFAFVRTPADNQSITCISNLSGQPTEIHIDGRSPEIAGAAPCSDLISGARFSGTGKVIPLNPYQTVWLTQG